MYNNKTVNNITLFIDAKQNTLIHVARLWLPESMDQKITT